MYAALTSPRMRMMYIDGAGSIETSAELIAGSLITRPDLTAEDDGGRGAAASIRKI